MKKVEGIVRTGVIDFDCIDEIRAGVYYDQKLQTLIHHFKYQRALALADAFADMLTPIILENALWRTSDLLIPVPLHKVKFRERSFNQSEEIAKALSGKVGIPCSADVLLRRTNTESQTQMADAQERVRNMTNVFVVKNTHTVSGKTVILIDDLITTGSTANACARVLKQHGAQKVYVLTVGRPYF
ncbi:ComF family protein [bacterium]|nr:ComF family protein [bacterium]